MNFDFFPLGDIDELENSNNSMGQIIDSEIPSLENIISLSETINLLNEENEDNKRLTLSQFKAKNIELLKEELLYYYLSPENLVDFTYNIVDNEKNYDFYKNIDCENFLSAQKKREKIFLSTSKSNLSIKQKKLSNYNDSLCAKISFTQNNKINTTNMKNSNLIKKKLEEYTLILLKEKEENKILSYLNEIKDIFKKSNIDMESLGLIHFNYIENNLNILLNIIIGKIEKKADKQIFTLFIESCLTILAYFKSSKLFYFIIEFIQNHKEIIESIEYFDNKVIFQFIPNNILNFDLLYNINLTKINLMDNIEEFLCEQENIEKNKYEWNFKNHWTLNNNDYLFIFIKMPFKKLNKDINNINSNDNNNNLNNNNVNNDEENNISNNNMDNNNYNNEQNNNEQNNNEQNNNEQNNNEQNNNKLNNIEDRNRSNLENNNSENYNSNNINNKDIGQKINQITNDNDYIYLKINLKNKNIINFGKIKLINNIEGNKEKIIDINISIKKEFIYIFYITENSSNNKKKYYLEYKIYNQCSMTLLKEDKIIIEDNIIPIKLFNDYKFIYCFSKSNKVIIIEKNYKLDQKKYVNCSIKLYEKDISINRDITDLESFEMFNCLSINNLLILNNTKENKKYVGKFIKNQNNNYILKIYELLNENKNNPQTFIIKVSYNENKIVITNFDINENILYFNMTTNDFNNFIDKGIFLLPFNSNNYDNNNFTNNIYEHLLKEYSSYQNIFGNFDIINKEKEENIIKFPLSCNFEKENLEFIINNIMENVNSDNIKLYYMIILKQIICTLYNSDIFEEEKIY